MKSPTVYRPDIVKKMWLNTISNSYFTKISLNFFCRWMGRISGHLLCCYAFHWIFTADIASLSNLSPG